MSRGNDRRSIVRDDDDRAAFVDVLGASVLNCGVRLHAWSLMDNHFHLLVETPSRGLSRFVKRLKETWSRVFQRRYHRSGHLFESRFRSILVERESYLAAVSRYIHLNPVRTKECFRLPPRERVRRLDAYPWSSNPGYRDAAAARPFETQDAVLEPYGGDDGSARDRYRAEMLRDLAEGRDVTSEAVAGAVLGGEEFLARARDRLSDRPEAEVPAKRVLITCVDRERVIAAVSAFLGMSREELLSSSGIRRALLADLLHRLAEMTNVEIGNLLGLHSSTVSLDRCRLAGMLRDDPAHSSLRSEIERSLGHTCS